MEEKRYMELLHMAAKETNEDVDAHNEEVITAYDIRVNDIVLSWLCSHVIRIKYYISTYVCRSFFF
jgi:hypothetical protein